MKWRTKQRPDLGAMVASAIALTRAKLSKSATRSKSSQGATEVPSDRSTGREMKGMIVSEQGPTSL